jgi:hypothetical protein
VVVVFDAVRLTLRLCPILDMDEAFNTVDHDILLSVTERTQFMLLQMPKTRLRQPVANPKGHLLDRQNWQC